MLDPDHPLRPILDRLRGYVTQGSHPSADEATYLRLLDELETGLFERLPEIVVTAVQEMGAHLHDSLDPILVEIAHDVIEGKEPSGGLIASFRLRLERYHELGTDETPIAGNVLPFDPFKKP